MIITSSVLEGLLGRLGASPDGQPGGSCEGGLFRKRLSWPAIPTIWSQEEARRLDAFCESWRSDGVGASKLLWSTKTTGSSVSEGWWTARFFRLLEFTARRMRVAILLLRLEEPSEPNEEVDELPEAVDTSDSVDVLRSTTEAFKRMAL